VIVKPNFSPQAIAPYVWKELVFTAAIAIAVCLLDHLGVVRIALPFAPIGVLGTALAIFLGFRNNSGHARWWEARTLWGNIVAQSRALGRLVMTAADNAAHLGKGGGAEACAAYQRELLYRQIAFAHALRSHLRGQDAAADLAPLLGAAELARLAGAANPPNLLLQLQAGRLKDGVREEKLGQFDPITLEPNLAALGTWQAACERIKATPLLRQYEFFTRVFLWTFLALLPPSLLGVLPADATRWATVPLALALGFVYAITNKIGQVTEDPFENRIHDVPLTALCNTIERDLREQLGERALPARAVAVDGYLF
jgi:putative membrane protein